MWILDYTQDVTERIENRGDSDALADALNNVLQDLGAFTPPTPTGDQWEYQMISAANATDLLNQANTQGTQGWELAAVVVDTSRPDKYVGFLKRKKQ